MDETRLICQPTEIMFQDAKWVDGTWDLKQFEKEGKTDWIHYSPTPLFIGGMLNKNVTIIIRPECYLHCPNLTIDVYFMRNQELTKELNAPPPGSKDLYFQTQYLQPSLTQTKACVLKQYWSNWRYPQDNAICLIVSSITHQFFPDMESSVDDNCVGDGGGGAGLGFPETHRLGLKFCQSDGTTGSTGPSGRIPAKVESGGSSGEAAFVDATEPIGSVPTEMDDPTSQDVKKALLA
ncbi:hypothetical protein DY000_02046617 [Brassica cretica]|uniref:Uncharacterized protein n=1 Tax=Brassica cretica TaxID=69181 RepID=A0ABQ7EUY2_BRACR|nr:hypothetical protein DY000_02046617 [Brassica cretica]